MPYLYDGFHKIESVNATVNGQQKEYEKLILKSAVAGLVIDDDAYMCLVRQYRPAIGDFTLEIPAGVMDKEGLSEIETLIEELKEECLIDPKDIISHSADPISKYHMIIGSSDATCAIYKVRVKDQFEIMQENHNDEVSSVHWYNAKEVQKLLYGDEIKDPKTIIAIYYYLYDYIAMGRQHGAKETKGY